MSGIFDQIINYSPPLIVSGTVNYKGTWNASTNNPTLNNPPAASTKGDYYVVSTAGTQFGISFAVGDWIISSGTAWEKVDLTDAVSSVFGRTGAVVGVSTDYSAVGLTNTAIGAANPSTGAFTTISATTPIAVASGGTGVSTSTGTTNVVLSNSPTLVTPILGTPQSGTLTSCTGLPISTGVSGLGTGVATALAVNVGSAGAPVVNGGALGTPSSGTVTNLTGTASININGTVGATTPSTVAATSLSTSGNLTFTGTGNRITGDFANATVANRVAFQNSTANSATVINALPSGTGTASGFVAYNNSDPTNAALMRIFNTGTEGAIQSGINGTGSYLPMTFYTGGSERARIDTSGNLGIGTATPAVRLDVVPTSTDGDITAMRLYNNRQASAATKVSLQFYADNDQVLLTAGRDGAGTSGTFNILTRKSGTQTSSLFINETGNVGIGTTSPGSKLDVNGNVAVTGTLSATSGYNGTVGATTPSTGAFTTLTTTGSISVADAANGILFTAGTGRVGGDATNSFLKNASAGGSILMQSSTNATIAAFTNTGLNSCAIGATTPSTVAATSVDSSGTITSTGAATQFRAKRTGQNADFRILQGVNNTVLDNNNGDELNLAIAGTYRATLSSTGLAVTGALSSTGALAIGNTVAAAVAVASTHKVTIVIGGTTYYLLATNV